MLQNEKLELSLEELKKETPDLSDAFCLFMAEAATVCMHLNDHTCPVELLIDGEYNKQYMLQWQEVTPEALRSHNDPDVAVEFGAYGVAMLIIPKFTAYTVIERSRKRTGFDFWLRTKDDKLFQSKARLEVSGIMSGNDKLIKARCDMKLKQCAKTNEHLTGYIVVVEFGSPRARIKTRIPKTVDSVQ